MNSTDLPSAPSGRPIAQSLLCPPFGEPPFKIRLEIFGGRHLSESQTSVTRQMYRECCRRCRYHFENLRYVLPDGKLSKKRRMRDTLLARKMGEAVVRIDFDCPPTFANSVNLPVEGPVTELRSGFSDDMWKICLACESDPDWHDHIVFHGGAFHIESILMEHLGLKTL